MVVTEGILSENVFDILAELLSQKAVTDPRFLESI